MNNKANATSFKKGHGRLRTDESYRKAAIKISLAKKGKKRASPSQASRDKISASLKGREILWADKISRVKAGDNYGLSIGQRYLRKLEKKAGRPRPDKCEVCQRSGRIYSDHCHKSGKFRGWLCVNCNNALGLVGDDTMILFALIAYVKSHSS